MSDIKELFEDAFRKECKDEIGGKDFDKTFDMFCDDMKEMAEVGKHIQTLIERIQDLCMSLSDRAVFCTDFGVVICVSAFDEPKGVFQYGFKQGVLNATQIMCAHVKETIAQQEEKEAQEEQEEHDEANE